MHKLKFTIRGGEARCTTCEATIPAGARSTVETHAEVIRPATDLEPRGLHRLFIDRRECDACVEKWDRARRIRNAFL